MSDHRTITPLTEDEFEARFPTIRNHIAENAAFDGHLFETYGREFEYVSEHDQRFVWTVVTGDDDALLICSGIRFVNRLGYLVSMKPVADGGSYEVCVS